MEFFSLMLSQSVPHLSIRSGKDILINNCLSELRFHVLSRINSLSIYKTFYTATFSVADIALQTDTIRLNFHLYPSLEVEICDFTKWVVWMGKSVPSWIFVKVCMKYKLSDWQLSSGPCVCGYYWDRQRERLKKIWITYFTSLF